MEKEKQLIILLIVIALLYILYQIRNRNRNRNIKEGFLEIDENARTDYESANKLQYKDTIYEKSAKIAFENNPKMLCNLLPIIPAEYCGDEDGNVSKKPKFPVHMLPMKDTTVMAVFNDGQLYKKDKVEYPFWTGPLENSLPNGSIPLRMISIDSEERLLGVGFNNNLYRKVSNDIESTWELIPNTDNIIYVIYQLENTFENDKIIAVDSQGRLNENIYNQLGSEPFKLVANDNETFPVLKVWFDKNGFMLGIGTNFKMYRKATTDWRNSEFDTVTGSNPSLINDAIYGKDGKMYGLVLIPKLGKIAVMKQKMVYYLSQFIPLEFISDKNNKEIISNSEVVKFKTGIDYTNDRYNDLQYGDINISEAKNKLKIEELRKIRSHCASRGSKTNVEHENYEFLNRLTKQQKHIDELNGVLSKMVSQDPSRSKIQEDII